METKPETTADKLKRLEEKYAKGELSRETYEELKEKYMREQQTLPPPAPPPPQYQPIPPVSIPAPIPYKTTGIPLVGGIFLILGALVNIFSQIMLLSTGGTPVLPSPWYEIIYFFFWMTAVFGLFLGLAGIMGSIFAFMRRSWDWTLLGGIICMCGYGFILALIGTILIAVSKKEFIPRKYHLPYVPGRSVWDALRYAPETETGIVLFFFTIVATPVIQEVFFSVNVSFNTIFILQVCLGLALSIMIVLMGVRYERKDPKMCRYRNLIHWGLGGLVVVIDIVIPVILALIYPPI